MENQYYCGALGWRNISPFLLPILIFFFARIDWKVYKLTKGKYILTVGVLLSVLFSLSRNLVCNNGVLDFLFLLLGFLIVIAAGTLISWLRDKSKK